MQKEKARKLLELYGKAWEMRDPELLSEIFTEDGTYLDPKEPINIGLEAIQRYWSNKVVNGQKDIRFLLKNIWIDDETVIAEWHASFIDIQQNVSIEMDEIGIFTGADGKFSSLREFYKTTKTPL